MAKKPAPAAETSTELALFTPANPVMIITNQVEAEKLFIHIEQQIAEFVPDLTTDAGRRAVASLAHKVSKTKTAIVAAAEELIEEERKKVNATVAERRRIEDRMDGLRDLARKPLTEWERIEGERQRHFDIAKAAIASSQIVQPTDTVETLKEELAKLAEEFDPDFYGADNIETLKVLAAQAHEVLESAVARMEQQERERAELEQLRAERAERARQEAERLEAERVATEQAEAAQRAADEAQRIADEERAAQEQAAENARLEKEAEQRRLEEAQQRAQEEERRRADQAIEDQRKAHQAELDRIAAEQAEKDRLAEEEAAAAAARAADQENRRKVKTDAKNAFMACGADEQTARNIVLSIIAGEIPNVTLKF